MSILREVGIEVEDALAVKVLQGYDQDRSGTLEMEEFRKVRALTFTTAVTLFVLVRHRSPLRIESRALLLHAGGGRAQSLPGCKRASCAGSGRARGCGR